MTLRILRGGVILTKCYHLLSAASQTWGWPVPTAYLMSIYPACFTVTFVMKNTEKRDDSKLQDCSTTGRVHAALSNP